MSTSLQIGELSGLLAVGAGVALLAIAFTIAYRIAVGSIDVNTLLKDGISRQASTARFQLLVFSFAIAFSYLIFLLKAASLCTASSCTMPDIPWSLLSLLGVSAAPMPLARSSTRQHPPTNEPSTPKPEEAKG